MLAGGNIFKYFSRRGQRTFLNSRASIDREQKGCGEVEGVEHGFGVVLPIKC